MLKTKFISPLIVVSDIEKSRSFYERYLDQEVQFDFGENISFTSGLSIHLKSHYEKLINNPVSQNYCNNFELYFEQDNLETLTDLLKSENIEFVHPLREEPWRQRVVRFYDPDKHIIEVGETMKALCLRLSNEGMSSSEISASTSLPEKYVDELCNSNTN